MNKKADERVLSIYLFVVYIIVAIGLVSGVLLFFGTPLDIRNLEAEILNNKVIDCFVEQGNVKQEIFQPDFDLVSFCNFNFKDNTYIDKEEQYSVKVSLFKFDSCSKSEEEFICLDKIKEISAGRQDFFEFCGLEGKKIPKCEKRTIYVLNNKEKVLLGVMGVVGKINKNV